MEEAFIKQTNWDMRKGRPYVIAGSKTLEQRLESDKIFKGFTGKQQAVFAILKGRIVRLEFKILS